MKNSERREFFRIDDRLTLKYRIISEEEFKLLENVVRFSPASSLIKADELSFIQNIELKEEQNKKDPIYAYLKLIDRKLDLIMDMLSERFEDKNIYTIQYTDVNISASGIRFISDIPMNSGEFVELIIILPIYPYMKISTLCKVIRCDKKQKNGESINEVSLHYLIINEYDRDILIKYILMKEREILRIKRDTLG